MGRLESGFLDVGKSSPDGTDSNSTSCQHDLIVFQVMEEAKQVSRSPASKGGRPNVARARKGRARFGFS